MSIEVGTIILAKNHHSGEREEHVVKSVTLAKHGNAYDVGVDGPFYEYEIQKGSDGRYYWESSTRGEMLWAGKDPGDPMQVLAELDSQLKQIRKRLRDLEEEPAKLREEANTFQEALTDFGERIKDLEDALDLEDVLGNINFSDVSGFEEYVKAIVEDEITEADWEDDIERVVRSWFNTQRDLVQADIKSRSDMTMALLKTQQLILEERERSSRRRWWQFWK